MGEPLPERIVLIGYRGSGKTSVGEAVAEYLSWRFFDTDREIERIEGMSINAIVSFKGWDAFREREKEVIKRVCMEKHCVIATGGGAVLDPENREIMRRTGKVIWLKAEGSLLYRRITNDPESRLRRPPLTSLDPHEEVNSVLREREPYYRETAHVILNTGNKSIDDVVEEIMCRIL